ncbi:MAG TPA: hypothetical protein VJB56_01300 [Candidatus Paceibacterota bacterium]|uniref:DNA-directed DNA polymerase n=1 Tax=Candidatus Giovannonibacteria bacterium RIFCSPLOWO2_01_FULL_46_32 TaxID=1798353 RepID=A0A1F5XF51_9BACT|nr:MAG: hypothetical protein A3B19_00515 [Candidatus Giovannonibacteria bacterium RIFCSPLOWO2_01_FULL_46_32]
MIYLVYGDDTKRSRALLHDFENRFRKEIPSAWHRIDAREERAEEIITQIVGARSLFSEKTYLLFLYATELPDAAKIILGAALKEWARDDSVILFYEEGAPKSDSLFKKLVKSASKKQEFGALSGTLLSKWVDEELKKQGVSLPIATKHFLIERYGDDLWRLALELEKAALGYLAGANEEKLSEKELFAIGDLWGSRERERAFLKYQRMLESGFGADQVFRTLLWHVKTMLLVAHKETRGVHPFVAGKAARQLKNFTGDALARAYEALLMLDVKEKWGRGSIEFGLYHFFLTN